jgi:serine/threonine-protein kinase
LEKIATGEHWQQLLSAVKKYSQAQLIDVDPQLFTNLNVAQQDPTYTQLWLDALLAPPKRDKLQTLNTGSSLKQGDYVIVGKLGAGGQGSAYLASRADGGQVVLKEYIFPLYVDNKARRRALESFEHEAAMLRKLDSSAIVKLEDCFVEDHRGYLVLEHIPGLNLRELVERDGPLDEPSVRELGVKMCDVLSYLHDQSPQIVHRDFTPDNLILMPDGSLKLIDFMVAQENSDSATASVVGKHAYLPPEQFRGRAVAQSDVYALGATLYYLLTGKDPEPLTSSHPILERDTVSGALDSTVALATDLDLSRRFSSAREVKLALLDCRGETISLHSERMLESR